MRTFGIIGNPLGHSFSQRYFTDKFTAGGIDARYLTFELPDIGDLMEVLSEYPDLEGFNVTIPYKKLITPYLASMSATAAEVGAVNVVRVIHSPESGPVLHGFNTDSPAFARTLGRMLPPSDEAISALVLGSGGASAAVCHALSALGIRSTVVSRNPGSGMIGYSDITAEVMAACQVVVNTTPLGMSPHSNEAPPIPYSLLTSGHVCYDLVYNPADTLFMQHARKQGAAVTNGMDMLRLQAALSWQIWNSSR